MAERDSGGLRLTMDDPQGLAPWNRTVHGFLSHSNETPAHLAAALEAAPHFALGWAAKGLFYMLLGRAELTALAREAHARAEAGLAAIGGTARERVYVDALGDYLRGRPSAAVRRFEALLETHPEDALAMKLDHQIRFVLGDNRGMARVMDGVIAAYPESHPLSGYARGCHAFALEETGAYALAERHGRAGLEIAGDDAWGLHAVAHVYDMTAQNRAGITWLSTQTDAWAHCNNFGYHVWWHLGLFHLDRGEFDQALALYDSRVRADKTDDYRDIANGASMLVRLEIEGVDVGDRWEELAELAATRVEDACVIFADLHYLLALEGDGRRPEADRLVARIAADAERTEHDMHEVAAVAGHPAAVGLAAFRAGQYGLAWDKLAEARPGMQRVGGSHAQRDVFTRLMIESAIRARRWPEAEAALVARAERRGAEDNFTHRRRAAIARARQAGVAAE